MPENKSVETTAVKKPVISAVQGTSSNKVTVYSKLLTDLKFPKWRNITLTTGVVNSQPEGEVIIRGRNSLGGVISPVASTVIDSHFWEYIKTTYSDYDPIKSNQIFVSTSIEEASIIAEDIDTNITEPMTEKTRSDKYKNDNIPAVKR